MAAITTIDLVLHTANVTGAGTDADVYLGLAGREFYVDSSLNDFEQGQNITYTFGVNPNVLNAGDNDPTQPLQLDTADLDRFPNRYIRMDPRGDGSGPNWVIEEVTVTVTSGQLSLRKFSRLGGNDTLKLGRKAGKFLYLNDDGGIVT